ncbi:MAG: CHAT domain-containing protein [Candidatus Thorarchaeota archaeon]|jgi:CHAT domain-containing protein/TPR repeat protein
MTEERSDELWLDETINTAIIRLLDTQSTDEIRQVFLEHSKELCSKRASEILTTKLAKLRQLPAIFPILKHRLRLVNDCQEHGLDYLLNDSLELQIPIASYFMYDPGTGTRQTVLSASRNQVIYDLKNSSEPFEEINHLRKAIELFSEDHAQILCGLIHELAYVQISKIDNSEHYREEIIHNLERSLRITIKFDFDEVRITNLRVTIGSQYNEYFKDNRTNDVSPAIYHLSKALEAPSSQSNIEQRKLVLLYLGEAFILSKQFTHALDQYLELEAIIDRNLRPDGWREIQKLLGKCYLVAYEETGKKEDINNSIDSFKKALEETHFEKHAFDWIHVNYWLGRCQLVIGQRENAMKSFEEARKVKSSTNPGDWFRSTMDLASTYYHGKSGNYSENIETAKRIIESAFGDFNKEKQPHAWALLCNTLGMIYSRRHVGDRADNLERIIELEEEALEFLKRKHHSENWIDANIILGNAYFERMHGIRSNNIEKSISHIEDVLDYIDRESDEKSWGICQNSLGLGYIYRSSGLKEENYRKAEGHFINAIEVYESLGLSSNWLDSSANLASLYTFQGDKHKSVRQIRKVVDSIDKKADPLIWARFANQLALALIQQEPVTEDNKSEITTILKQTSVIFEIDKFPNEHRKSITRLGDFHFSVEDWDNALQAYYRAIEAGEIMLFESYTDVGQRYVVSGNTEQYPRAAYCLLKQNKISEAFCMLENGKARLLSRALAINNLDLEGLSNEVRESMIETKLKVQELELSKRLATNSTSRSDYRKIVDEYMKARSELNTLILEIQESNSSFMNLSLELSDILNLVPVGGALIAPLVTSHGSVCFVIPSGIQKLTEENVIWLNEYTSRDLNQVLRGKADPQKGNGWTSIYYDFIRNQTKSKFERWKLVMKKSTENLWKNMMDPIHQRLIKLKVERNSPVIVLPQGGLGMLPLHAAYRRVEDKDCTFGDEYNVVHIPSVYLLRISQERSKDLHEMNPLVLSVVNPTRDLDYSISEGDSISFVFKPNVRELVEYDATRNNFVEQAKGCTYLHFTGHGFYNWRDPMRSGLLLAKSETEKADPFTLVEITSFLDLTTTKLVTLSACESGLTDIWSTPDEYIGLPTGFIQAGTPSVLSSLWSVGDLSTSLLMKCFYEKHVLKNNPISHALKKAQNWLRYEVSRPYVIDYITNLMDSLRMRKRSVNEFSEENQRLEKQILFLTSELHRFEMEESKNPGERPFDHPFYWAGFTVTGSHLL